jgi:hypothetical protein
VPEKSGRHQRGVALTVLGRPWRHCDELPVMDCGSGDRVRTIGTGRGRGMEECLGVARLLRRPRGERKKWGSARRCVGKGGGAVGCRSRRCVEEKMGPAGAPT